MTTGNTENQKTLWSPDDDILAVVNDYGKAERTIQNLLDGGIKPKNIVLHSGEEALKFLNAGEDKVDWLTGIAHSIWRVLSDEKMELEQYEEQVKMGRHIISVHLDDKDEMHAAHEALRRQGAHHIRFFGKWAFEELPA